MAPFRTKASYVAGRGNALYTIPIGSYSRMGAVPKKAASNVIAKLPAKTLNAAVKKALKAQAEKKQVAISTQNIPVGTGLAGTALVVRLSPTAAGLSITQGATSAQRVGNRIRIAKAVLRIALSPNAYDATNNLLPCPSNVTMYVVSNKTTPATMLDPQYTGNFFRLGTTILGMSGSNTDKDMPINTEDWTLYYKRNFKIGYAAAVMTPGLSLANQGYANNDFLGSASFSLDVTKWMPAIVHYDGAGADPTTRMLYVVFESVNAMGALATQTVGSLIDYVIEIQYTDV